VTVDDVTRLVEAELRRVTDADFEMRIRALLVRPYPVEGIWDYGEPGEQYTCWVVAHDPHYAVGIAYCAQGFGPRAPWGLISLSGSHTSIGMDSAWFRSLEVAVRDMTA
jgi:hypothetical protein